MLREVPAAAAAAAVVVPVQKQIPGEAAAVVPAVVPAAVPAAEEVVVPAAAAVVVAAAAAVGQWIQRTDAIAKTVVGRRAGQTLWRRESAGAG